MVSAFDVKFRNSFPIAIFSSSFIVSHFTSYSFIFLELVLLHEVKGSNLVSPQMVSRFFSTPLSISNATFIQFSSVAQLCLTLAAPWTAARQASLSITNSRSLLKLTSIESVMPSKHLILCRPLLLPSIFPYVMVFSNESALCIRWPSIGVSASAAVVEMNIQD